MLRAAGVLLLVPLVLAGCSSRGSAPIYNRTIGEPPARGTAARSPAARPPVYARSYYLVQPGDTLYSIAWRQNLSYRQLASWNGIRPPNYQIFPGQRLRLKPPATRRSAPQARVPRPPVSQPARPASTPRVKPVGRPSAQREKALAGVSKPAKPAGTAKSLKLVWDWPTKGRVVQTFSAASDNRKGIWINGRMGQPVTAAEAGKVVYAGNGLVGYGNLIIIKHDRSYLSAYGYNSKLLVKEGDRVKKGDVVAHMGAPNSGGQPVLHFEIRRHGKPVNPLPMLPKK
jgi:lipoprotein NlpD